MVPRLKYIHHENDDVYDDDDEKFTFIESLLGPDTSSRTLC